MVPGHLITRGSSKALARSSSAEDAAWGSTMQRIRVRTLAVGSVPSWRVHEMDLSQVPKEHWIIPFAQAMAKTASVNAPKPRCFCLASLLKEQSPGGFCKSLAQRWILGNETKNLLDALILKIAFYRYAKISAIRSCRSHSLFKRRASLTKEKLWTFFCWSFKFQQLLVQDTPSCQTLAGLEVIKNRFDHCELTIVGYFKGTKGRHGGATLQFSPPDGWKQYFRVFCCLK